MAKKKATSKKGLAKTDGPNLPTEFNFEQDLGAGMEGTDKDSFAIPFLAVIQKMSPQVDEAEAEYIEDARPGMLFNSVTNELFDGKEGVIFLPCAFQRRFIRWAPRGKGGGFKGEMTPEDAFELEQRDEVVNDSGRLYYPDKDGEIDPDENDFLADTRNHFGILLHDGQAVPVVLSLASTQIKKSKQMMTLLNGVKVAGKNGLVTPPTWVNRIKITTVPESNEKGSWHGVKVELDGFIDSQDTYNIARSLHEIIAKGAATVNYDSVAPKGEGEDDKF